MASCANVSTVHLSAVSNGMNILLAEDDAISRLMVRRILEQEGHLVTVARNGTEAVEAFEPSRFDIVLMDIQMPIMDGFRATYEIRKKERPGELRIPIIAFTAIDFSDAFQKAGMDGYVAKPVNVDALLRTVKAAAAGR